MLAAVVPLAVAQNKPIAQIAKTASGVYQLSVDGKPFIILGGQVNNPSAFPDRMRRAWPEFKALHANTIEFPVYWDTIEPVEGKFDFSGFDEIVRSMKQDFEKVATRKPKSSRDRSAETYLLGMKRKAIS